MAKQVIWSLVAKKQLKEAFQILKLKNGRVGTGTGNDHLRLALKGNLHHLVVIDESIVIHWIFRLREMVHW